MEAAARFSARTISADAFNFERLAQGCEAESGCSLPNHFVDVAIIEFRDRPAFPANQKLTRMWIARIGTTDKRIERIQAVDEVCLDQEIQRPVDCRRRDLPTSAIEAVQDIVGTDRLVAGPDQLQYPPALLCEAKSSLAADLYGRRNGFRYAMLVIVLFTGKLFAGIRPDHVLCSHR